MLKCDKFEPSHEIIDNSSWRNRHALPGSPPALLYGWGNGYVKLPPDHKWWGKDYDKIDVDVHGGLTYASLDKEGINWVIGFDTAHYRDDLRRWPKKEVERETLRLLEQCL